LVFCRSRLRRNEIHTCWPSAQLCRRTSRSIGCCRHSSQPRALGGSSCQRRTGGIGWGSTVSFSFFVVFAEHDCRAWVHGTGRADLWQVAPDWRGARVSAFWFCRSCTNPAARRRRLGNSTNSRSIHSDSALRRDHPCACRIRWPLTSAKSFGYAFPQELIDSKAIRRLSCQTPPIG